MSNADLICVLGASDPEMEIIEKLLRDCGVTVVYATTPDGQRVTPAEAYRCPVPDVPEGSAVYAVECIDVLPEGWERIDHHRPGDPGYGRPPSEFFAASSIGQVCAALGLAIIYSHRDDACRVLSEHEGQRDWAYAWSGIGDISSASEDVFATVRPGAQSWPTGKHGMWAGLPLPEHARTLDLDAQDVIFAAAADHCLAAAYRGECPGVDPDELMRWRVESRAKFQGRSADEILADIERARLALRRAPTIQLDEADQARDMRGQHTPELPEASAREGICFVADGLPGRDGRMKVVCQSGSPAQIEAFMRVWAPAQGLTDIYGDPARGFAGGYKD